MNLQRTPQQQYLTPILEILALRRDGSERTQVIRKELHQLMGEQFNSADRKKVRIEGSRFEPAWWNQSRHADEQMRKANNGLLAPSIEHTIWTITQKGRKYLSGQKNQMRLAALSSL